MATSNQKTDNSLRFKAWRQIWSKPGIEVFRSILDFLRERPSALYLSALSLVYISWMTPVIIIFAFTANQLIVEIFQMKRAMDVQQNLMSGYIGELEKQAGVTAKKHVISDYLEWEYQDIDSFSRNIGNFLGISTYSIDDMVDFYHVETQDALNSNLVCYPIHPYHSCIFYNEPPTVKLGPFQKFTLLHELGHSLLSSISGSAFAWHCIKLLTIHFALLVFFVAWPTAPWYVFAGSLLLILLTLFDKYFITRNQQLMDEFMADSFAITYLDDGETDRLSVLFEKYAMMFADSELDSKQNALREKELQKNIGIAKNKERKYEPGTIFYDTPKRRLFVLLLINSIVVIPSFYSRTPGYLFVASLIFTTLCLYGTHKFAHQLISVRDDIIAQKLKNWK